MCRSIKTLRPPYLEPTEDDVRAAALQFVRKISGYRVPSRANEEAFERAVADVSRASSTLLDSLVLGATSRLGSGTGPEKTGKREAPASVRGQRSVRS
jgi:hypothetical protein